MGHRTTPLAAAITSGLITLALAPTAGAQPTTPTTGDGTAQQPVVVVMDYSESMLEADADETGTTRIQAAKDATKDLIAKTPENARLGMIAFGHADRQTCTTIETLQKVDTIDKDALLAKVDALNAQGGTPIGQSLSRAADELRGIEGEKSIILVSDGEPTCDEPPACEVAQQLADQGIDLTVHTIGFRLSGNAKAQETLECIANATGGTYTPAEDAAQLTETLTTQTTRAIQGYQTTGTPVRGGQDAAAAPRLTAGQYVDQLPALAWDTFPDPQGASFPDGTVRFYKVPMHEGYRPVVSATSVLDPEDEQREELRRLSIRTVGPDGAEALCQGMRMSADKIHFTGALESDLTVVHNRKEDADRAMEPDSTCLTEDGEMLYAIYQENETPTGTENPVEITVSYEATGEDSVGSPSTEDAFPAPELGAATPTPGGGSFNDATLLTPGQTISDTVLAGERRYFAVDVASNQALAYRLRADTPQHAGQSVSVSLYNPLREQMQQSIDGGQPSVSSLRGDLNEVSDDAGNGVMTGSTATVIHPNHRLAPRNAPLASEGDTVSVPGRQYVIVTLGRPDMFPEDAAASADFDLVVDVVGTPEKTGDGERPRFITTADQYRVAFGEDEALSEENPAAAPTGDGAASAASGSAAGEAAEEGAGRAAGDTATAEAAADTDAAGGAPTWALVLGGIGLLAVGGGVAALTLGRRH